MNKYAQAVLLALAVVFTSVTLRRATASALGSEWQPSFLMNGGSLAPAPPLHSGTGGAPVPSAHVVSRTVAIGGAPVPPPHVVSGSLAIGGAPVPPPHAGSETLAIGGAPVPPPHVVSGGLAIGGAPLPPPHAG
jgi:hypothetical protein